MQPVTAFVLAGGRSTRMGTDKAFLQLKGKSLLANALELARSVTRDVRIVGDPAKFANFAATVEDTYRDRGPLGGIHAALTSSATELNLIIAVDLPLLRTQFLHYLSSIAERCDSIVTIPKVAAHYEPLCAVYRKPFSVLAENALAANRNKIDALFAGISLRVISEEELDPNGFPTAMFRNVNTPSDWRLAEEEFSRREHVS
jgi:molybdopterin-guanine dinucleotide biosynthesis protein A